MSKVYVLAVDPGNDKTGLAKLSRDGELVERAIVSTDNLPEEIDNRLKKPSTIEHVVCGNGTNHKHIYPLIQEAARQHKVTTSLIDESYSTEEAKKLYWEFNPPRGLKKMVPQGMRTIPEPVDDITAFVIGTRYINKEIKIAERKAAEEALAAQRQAEKRKAQEAEAEETEFEQDVLEHYTDQEENK